PIGERSGGAPEPEQPRQQCSGADERSDLQAVRAEIAQPDRGVHFFFPTRREISRRSASERRRSCTRCARSGRAEPLKTLSTNSRTSSLITRFFGRVGR